jgi:hypothetical protein
MLGTTRFSNVFAKLAAGAALLTVVLAGLGFQAIPPAAAANTIYYVDCAGNDANNGTSTTTPWKTMARASQQTYGAGDQILFKRGCTFSGTGFKPVGNGTVASPVTIADYGTGNLPILTGVGAHEAAIQMYNTQNYVLRNLDLKQSGQTPITDPSVNRNFDDQTMKANLDIRGIQSGIDNINCGEPCTVRNITIDGLKVHGGTWKGINVGAGLYDLKSGPVYGYVDNVLVQNTEVYGNTMVGIDVYSTYTKQISYHASHITIRVSYLHDNGWDGIRMGPVDHGLIDSNQCSYNGSLQDARLGCWGWDSHDLVMQFNESHHNMTPVTDRHARDGGGFDCDLGSEDCLMQYNWSHDNQGEGYLTLTWPIGYGFSRGVSHNIQMRYNIGERDGKKLAGAWYNFGGVENLVVYNNTLYYEPARVHIGGINAFVCDAGAAACHDTWGAGGSTTTNYVYNNIFITTPNPSGGPSLLEWTDGTGTWTFDNNLWYRTQGGFESSTCTTWACWQGLGRDLNGYNANPGLVGPLGGGPAAYHLTAGSIAINHARVVTQGLRGMGTRDYFGTTTPVGGAYDIGADEY